MANEPANDNLEIGDPREGELPYPPSWSSPRARAKRRLIEFTLLMLSLGLWLLMLSPALRFFL